MTDLLRKPQRSWREIADEASHERDPQKLIQLSEELTRALDERDRKSGTPKKQIVMLTPESTQDR